MQGEKTAQKYPDGSTILMSGHEWTVELMGRHGDALLPNPEDSNLYRLSRHNTKSILRWQFEIDEQQKGATK
jgi:hypothetical protein